MEEHDSHDGTQETGITKEMLERLKARDNRFSAIDTAIQLDEELRDSMALKILLGVIGIELDDARDELEKVDATDFNAIKNLQAKAYRARFISTTLENVRRKGTQAAAELEAEGTIDMREFDDNLEG